MRMFIASLFLSLSCLFGFVACQSSEDDGVTTNPPQLPTLVVAEQTTVMESDYGWTEAVITLSLDGTPVENASLQAATQGVTATEGEDYKRLNNRIFFNAAGEAEVRVRIYGDLHREENEEITITFGGGTNVNAEGQSTTLIIENNDAVDNPFSIPPDGEDVASEYPGYSLVWSDEFDDPATLTTNYVHDLGSQFNGWGNNELQFYQTENAVIGDGHLIITAREENRGGKNYTSSRLKTKDRHEFTYGRIDVRAALPEGQGVWPAIWMLGANIDQIGWPRCGEIDIMEMLGHETNTLHGTVHFHNGGGHQFIGNSTPVPEGLNRRFNVFSVVWTPDALEWRLNDVPYHTVTRSSIGNGWVFDLPQFFLFNIAVGGNWPGSPDGTTRFPQRMFIDYVRVYQQD